MSKDNKTFDLEDRLIDFAVRIIQVAESLPKEKSWKSYWRTTHSLRNLSCA